MILTVTASADVGLITFLPLLLYLLIILFVVSFVLFIRKLLVNSSAKVVHNAEISKKLDRIIELLEKQNNN
ncbi:DUF4083 family protein [Chengkuizengella axinellae]|uniref:DUF4083 family protein n=1 Tax=Chengkuizengella axinellae TaxID=3064388 RepID=A0ABT9IXK5_9BACL|nr:DUF4083 family protein [Chengkuizengella sp. 2205SS18-9]MDP5274104.1 DUF4083 family protein [Chengkuizengella sp. 2205SS18-9]